MIQFGISLARQPDIAIRAFLVRRQDFLVNARLVIIALQMRGGGELDEIFVAGLVLRQQSEMMINIAPAAAGFLFQPAEPGAT